MSYAVGAINAKEAFDPLADFKRLESLSTIGHCGASPLKVGSQARAVDLYHHQPWKELCRQLVRLCLFEHGRASGVGVYNRTRNINV
jgi:hypothetical protein